MAINYFFLILVKFTAADIYTILIELLIYAFSFLRLLIGHQQGHWCCKN